MTNKKILKDRKQTYPFKTMKIGETFMIHHSKYNSMLTAWRYHNKNFEPIDIDAERILGKYIIKRIA